MPAPVARKTDLGESLIQKRRGRIGFPKAQNVHALGTGNFEPRENDDIARSRRFAEPVEPGHVVVFGDGDYAEACFQHASNVLLSESFLLCFGIEVSARTEVSVNGRVELEIGKAEASSSRVFA